MYYQRIFQAMATTPITLSEVLWAELLWDASKGAFSASIILAIGALTGDFNPVGSLVALPVAFFGTLIFAGMGLWVAAVSKSIEQINYPQYLVIFPMFLFCGVFFPLERLPFAFVVLAWFFPLTPVISLLRTLVLGLPLEGQSLPLMLFWATGFIYFARRSMFYRLIK
jgi:lipooligosaccharide transport system permease protein